MLSHVVFLNILHVYDSLHSNHENAYEIFLVLGHFKITRILLCSLKDHKNAIKVKPHRSLSFCSSDNNSLAEDLHFISLFFGKQAQCSFNMRRHFHNMRCVENSPENRDVSQSELVGTLATTYVWDLQESHAFVSRLTSTQNIRSSMKDLLLSKMFYSKTIDSNDVWAQKQPWTIKINLRFSNPLMSYWWR